MSKLTLDEAIKHCLDIADGQDKCAEISVSERAKERISQCAADYRQLAEWLTELKELREKIKKLEKELKVAKLINYADVQCIKHGYWEEVTDYGGWGDTHYRCSVCGEEWYLEDGKPKDNNMNFCPRCGAKMDGEQNDD